jgi:hypothetical protein
MTTVTHFTFFIPHSPPTSSLSLTWPVLHSVLHCLSVWSLFKGFALAFHLQIYCTFISITPLLFSLAFPLTLCWSSAFNVFCCVLFLHRCNLFQHYSIILFSSPSCAYYPQTVPLLEKCLSIYVIWSWLYLCIHFSFGSIFHIWEKTCDPYLSEHGLFHLTWWPPVSSIYL